MISHKSKWYIIRDSSGIEELKSDQMKKHEEYANFVNKCSSQTDNHWTLKIMMILLTPKMPKQYVLNLYWIYFNRPSKTLLSASTIKGVVHNVMLSQ